MFFFLTLVVLALAGLPEDVAVVNASQKEIGINASLLVTIAVCLYILNLPGLAGFVLFALLLYSVFADGVLPVQDSDFKSICLNLNNTLVKELQSLQSKYQQETEQKKEQLRQQIDSLNEQIYQLSRLYDEFTDRGVFGQYERKLEAKRKVLCQTVNLTLTNVIYSVAPGIYVLSDVHTTKILAQLKSLAPKLDSITQNWIDSVVQLLKSSGNEEEFLSHLDTLKDSLVLMVKPFDCPGFLTAISILKELQLRSEANTFILMMKYIMKIETPELSRSRKIFIYLRKLTLVTWPIEAPFASRHLIAFVVLVITIAVMTNLFNLKRKLGIKQVQSLVVVSVICGLVMMF